MYVYMYIPVCIYIYIYIRIIFFQVWVYCLGPGRCLEMFEDAVILILTNVQPKRSHEDNTSAYLYVSFYDNK